MGKGVACRNAKCRILDRATERKRKHEKPKFRENIAVTLGMQEGQMPLQYCFKLRMFVLATQLKRRKQIEIF